MSDAAIKTRAPKEPLFSKKNKKLVTDPLTDNNPVTIQVLGICSALAITVQVEQGVVMGGAVLFVLILGNMIISMMRNLIPSRIRIIVQLVVVAALVIIVNELLKAYLPDVSEKLSVFVGLIITNCIIMGRFEAFAMANKPWPSIMDAIGNGLGYAGLLILVAVFRELFGSGSLYGFPIFGSPIPTADSPLGTGLFSMGYMNNNMMILPPMALIIVGIIIWVQRSRNKTLIEQH
ncbi:MAG: NADH:ubiquinone reductase (Na(+)-transporting) subunit D [Crocinitomicaceae bacterium]|jgi:Na+-transporting NADH:ubiquinone oxidoreductase subunit D